MSWHFHPRAQARNSTWEKTFVQMNQAFRVRTHPQCLRPWQAPAGVNAVTSADRRPSVLVLSRQLWVWGPRALSRSLKPWGRRGRTTAPSAAARAPTASPAPPTPKPTADTVSEDFLWKYFFGNILSETFILTFYRFGGLQRDRRDEAKPR